MRGWCTRSSAATSAVEQLPWHTQTSCGGYPPQVAERVEVCVFAHEDEPLLAGMRPDGHVGNDTQTPKPRS